MQAPGMRSARLAGRVMTSERSRGTGQVVLYLDFDGCLHPSSVFFSPKRGPFLWSAPGRLFEHAGLLEQLLAPYNDICIVLSTAWVVRQSYSKTRGRLPAGLRGRTVGATFHSAMDRAAFEQLSRGQQVSADASRRLPRAWFALDDDSQDWPLETRGHLIETDTIRGIAAPFVRDAIEQRLVQLCQT